MKNTSQIMFFRRRQFGFSLVEMIGVLAIIAILAVIIVPKVFSTIASSRITNAAGSIGALKSAVTELAGKYGTIPLTNANSRIDDLLVKDGLLESRFVVKIGTQPGNPPIAGAAWTRNAGAWAAAGGANQATQSRVICVNSTATAPSVGANFRLDGTNDLPVGSRLVSAVIVGATINEAREMSLRLDGETLSSPPATPTIADDTGKVVYAAPNAAGTTTIYIYLAHQ